MARNSGFTLVELMITVAIVGILAAIAFPAYRGYAVKTRRVDAQRCLLVATQQMERYFVANNSYVGAAVGGAPIVTNCPDTGTAYYTLSFPAAATATAFTLRATPVATAGNRSDGYLEFTSDGAKRWDKNNDGSISGAYETTW
jgi:type IV pilus assembly protein PilE